MRHRESPGTHFSSTVVAGVDAAHANAAALHGAATGDAPGLKAVGDDANISLKLSPKGSGQVLIGSQVIGTREAAVVGTAGAATYTAAQLLGGVIARDPAGANRADVTPTAAQIVAAIPDVAVGSSFEFLIVNTADGAETITLTADAGVTLVGTMTIAQNASRRFTAIVTAVDTPAVSIYA